jgi:hypothetical protein
LTSNSLFSSRVIIQIRFDPVNVLPIKTNMARHAQMVKTMENVEAAYRRAFSMLSGGRVDI